jgi:predicted aspartyl protease
MGAFTVKSLGGRLARRMLAALLASGLAVTATPALADAACEYSELAVVPLSFPGNGTHAAMAGRLNGKNVQMMVDTGAQKTMLTRAEAERQDLPKVLQTTFTSGIGGGASMYSVRVSDIVIGPAEARYVRLAVIDSLGFSSFGAVVGADFLLQSDLEIAFADQQLKFFQGDGCDAWKEKWLAYWDPGAGRIPVHAGKNGDRRPVFEVLLNGQKVRAMIDTGAALSLLDLRAAARAGITPQSPGVIAAGRMGGFGHDKVPQWKAPFASFSIGDETITGPQVRIADMFGNATNPQAPEMLLGRDFLMVHRVLLAPSQDSLYFTYLGGTVFQ